MISVAAVAVGLCRICLARYDPALAVVLLAAPPGAAMPDVPVASWPGVRAAVVGAAVRAELLDARGETDAQADCDLFDRAERFAENLDMLRERRVDLAHAPPIGDAHRLPRPDVLAAGCDAYWTFCRRVEAVAAANPARRNAVRGTLAEADRFFAAWSAARQARDPGAVVPDRRRALKRLRSLVGEAAYNRVELPHLPRLGADGGR